jgi:hypothetical protein
MNRYEGSVYEVLLRVACHSVILGSDRGWSPRVVTLLVTSDKDLHRMNARAVARSRILEPI